MTADSTGEPRLVAPHIVHLNHFDLALCVMQAARLRAVHEARKTPPGRDFRNHPTMSQFGAHLVGAMGELSLGRWIGCRPAWTVQPVTDGGVDMTLPNGQLAQVKTYTFGGPGFVVAIPDPSKLATANLLVAARALNPASVEILGWLPCETFVTNCFRKDFGYGLHHAVQPSLLERDFTPLAHVDSAQAAA